MKADVLRTVFRTSSIYLVFTLLNRAIPFLLIPLLTRYIEPRGYGIISLLGVVTTMAMPLIGLCSNTVLFQRYNQLPSGQRALLVNDCYKVVLAGAGIAVAVAPVFAVPLRQYMGIQLFWFEVALITSAAGMVLTLALALCQIKMQPVPYGLLQTASSLTNVVLTILLVVVLEQSWQGRLSAICLAGVAVALISVYVNHRNGDLDFSRLLQASQLKNIVRLGSALIPSTIAGGVIAMSDRFFLGAMTTMTVVGIYAVGVSFAQVTDILLNSLNQACLPYLYKHGHSDDRTTRIRIVQGVYAVAFISFAVALLVTLVAPIVIDYMVDARYHDAKHVVGWLSLSFAFVSIGSAFQGLILIVERNTATAYISVAALMVNLLGTYVLVGRFGMVGAAMGVALGSLMSLLLHIAASFKYNNLPWLDPDVFRLSATYS